MYRKTLQFLAYDSLNSEMWCFRQHCCSVACMNGMLSAKCMQNQGCSGVTCYNMDEHFQRHQDPCKFGFG